MLRFKKALVTGASGFIGGRLTEQLILDHGVEVRALVSRFTHASRIARFNLEMVGGGIDDAEAVDRAVAGCEVVFHCAHDFEHPQRNLDGARALAEASLRHGVRRLVYVSSISVYEPLPDLEVDESTKSEPCGWTYPDNKLAVENMLLEFGAGHGLPVAVLQPTIVYGPYSRPWTLDPVIRLRSGRVVLPDDGGGVCNPVYVDDVVAALLAAAEDEAAVGERFLISGPDAVTWREFYAAYERLLGTQSVVLMPTGEIQRLNGQKGEVSNFQLSKRDPFKLLNYTLVRRIYKFVRRHRIGEGLRKQAKQALPPPLYLPDEVRLALLRARARVKIDKARRMLGYQPAYDFNRGMALTAKYIEWAQL